MGRQTQNDRELIQTLQYQMAKDQEKLTTISKEFQQFKGKSQEDKEFLQDIQKETVAMSETIGKLDSQVLIERKKLVSLENLELEKKLNKNLEKILAFEDLVKGEREN